MNRIESLDAQAGRLWTDTIAWLTGNSLNIALAVGGRHRHRARSARHPLARLPAARARQGRRSRTGATIFARVLARTGFFFIVLASAELVAEHAATPPSLLNIIHILFVIAAAFQAAIWARELVLGIVEHRAGGDDEHSSLRLGDRDHPPAGQHRPVRDRDHPDPRQSRRQRHRPDRRPRHRRHRHRPRRAGHLLRPVRGAVDHLRQAVPQRRHDHLRHHHRHGREYRPQEHPHPRPDRRGGDRLQRQIARAAGAELGADRPPPRADDLRPRLPDRARRCSPRSRSR